MEAIKIKKILLVLMLIMSALPFAAIGQSTPNEFGQRALLYKETGPESQIKKYLCAPTDASKDGGSTGSVTGGGADSTVAANNSASGDLYTCINKLYRFALVFGSVTAVFFIVIAGWVYMSAEGNNESIEKAKNILVSSIAGLIILFTGYILLKAINPQLVQFQTIQPPSVALNPATQADYDKIIADLNREGSGGVDASKIGKSGIAGCNNCDDYTKNNLTGNATQKSGQNTFLHKELIEKLQKVKTSYSDFRINEAYPPTVNHSSSCHNDGTCADLGVNTKTEAEIDKLCKAVKDAGLRILNEYSGFQNSLMPNCPTQRTYSTTKGGHLHVY